MGSARLIHTSLVPRGGWWYFQPETGVSLKGDDYYLLRDQVERHRHYRGLDMDTIDADIVEQICMRLGEVFCRDVEEFYPDRTQGITLEQVFSLNRAMIEFLKSGARVVDAGEASRRAEICRQCVFNRDINHCACSVFFKALTAVLGGRKGMDGLKICSVCGCALKAKVWMPNEVIRASNKETAFPAWCWQRIDNQVNTGTTSKEQS